MARSLTVMTESWPIAGTFTISRGSRTQQPVVVAEIRDGDLVGRGECVPYPRYGETVEGVAALIEAQAAAIAGGIDREGLTAALKAGAARNALDCALWDLEAKRTGRRAWDLAGIPAPKPVVTCYTLSLGTPDSMHKAAQAAADRPLLKVKLGGGEEDAERIAAVREGAPKSELVCDANEGWTPQTIAANLAACAKVGVRLVEQPLPAADDDFLRQIDRPLPICADESVHDRATLGKLAGKYDAINIKLDKTGGLTEALAMARAAEEAGLKIMVGCMVGTSLAMAPAMLIAAKASWVDLDGPLLLARDRADGLLFEGSTVHPPSAALWG